MAGDEARARIGWLASSDIRLLFDDDNGLLDPSEWPREMAYCVKPFRRRRSGFTFVLHNSLEALITILDQVGRSKAGSTA